MTERLFIDDTVAARRDLAEDKEYQANKKKAEREREKQEEENLKY